MKKNEEHVFEIRTIIFAVHKKNCCGCLMKSLSDTINSTGIFRLGKIDCTKINDPDKIKIIKSVVNKK